MGCPVSAVGYQVLPHTPARNLPPVEHRGNGMHYCPTV